ncbi:Uncharacterised protein [Mycobacteroides abscessus subsp. abscessus]|nr:Uncharacterised protein [Mycobacteroides abscessus subsp. abscessus]SLE22547.1 Uncharacterised protein [Mycobacteroides abscessus subsp. abscessus]
MLIPDAELLERSRLYAGGLRRAATHAAREQT